MPSHILIAGLISFFTTETREDTIPAPLFCVSSSQSSHILNLDRAERSLKEVDPDLSSSKSPTCLLSRKTKKERNTEKARRGEAGRGGAGRGEAGRGEAMEGKGRHNIKGKAKKTNTQKRQNFSVPTSFPREAESLVVQTKALLPYSLLICL